MTTEHAEHHAGTERNDGVFNMWQVFIFSMIPLALVFAGVIIGSVHGLDSDPEVFPSSPPPATSPTGAPGSSLFDQQVGPAYTLVYADRTPFSS